jgi:hypothetical protein
MKNFECHIVIEKDRQDLKEEKQKQNQRVRSLFQVTTKNKEVIKTQYMNNIYT